MKYPNDNQSVPEISSFQKLNRTAMPSALIFEITRLEFLVQQQIHELHFKITNRWSSFVEMGEAREGHPSMQSFTH